MLYEARCELMEGDLEQSEFDNANYLFNLHKNNFLSGNVLLKQADVAKEHNEKKAEEEESSISVVKVS